MTSHQKSFIVELILIASSATAVAHPSIQATVDGVPTTLYVQNPSWSEATVSGDSVSFGFNNRMYLSRSEETDVSQYFAPDMLGGYVEYDVDLSQVGCGCVTAFYGVNMPAVDNTEDPFKYCGAGKSAKAACPEFDIMEANSFGFRSTSHKCDPADENGVFSQCDHSGQCTVDVLRNETEDDYGPGASNAIDTTKPFSVRADYQESKLGSAESDRRWTAFTVTLTQGDSQVTMSAGDCTYLQGMSYNVRSGMAFVLSNWAPQNLDWVQHGTCSGECDKENVFSTISNLRFNTTGAIESYLDYNLYQFGSKCGEWQDTSSCDEYCENCHVSWLYGDELKGESPDAKCRCMNQQRAPHGYTYGPNQCSTSTAGLCDGATDCRWSWPSDDPAKWASAEALCRPMPQDRDWTFGGECKAKYAGECAADCSSCRWSWPADDELKWNSEEADCRCPSSAIKEIEFGGECEMNNFGECGGWCRDCRWSWFADDADRWAGDSANCRCLNWW